MEIVLRKQAIEAGLTHFFTGEPCAHGHLAMRYTSNKRCVKCAYEGYGEGRGRARADARAVGEPFYQGRPCPRGHTKRYATTSVCFECARENSLARSRQERKAKPSWFSVHDASTISRTRKLADLMSEITGEPWELDHIVPIMGKNVCGLHVAGNIQAMPRSLNRRKSNRFETLEQEVA